jgi:hypothetical protein
MYHSSRFAGLLPHPRDAAGGEPATVADAALLEVELGIAIRRNASGVEYQPRSVTDDATPDVVNMEPVLPHLNGVDATR